jgi:calcium-dependent protein kinase
VIFYMMISYRPPFNGDSETEVMENILKLEATFKGPAFKTVSKQCVELMRKLLNKNPDERPSALQAYEHPWIQKHLSYKSTDKHEGAMDTLSTFKVGLPPLSSRTAWRQWSSPSSCRRS